MTRRDSSDAELDALQQVCERLSGFDARYSAEWVDGAFAALLAGPSVPAGPEFVVESLFDDTWARTFGDPEDVARALQPLAARWRVLRSQLDPEALYDDPDALRLSPLLLAVPDGVGDEAGAGEPEGEDDAGRLAAPRLGEDWAAGFRAVADDPAWAWSSTPDADTLAELLAPLDALRLDADALAAHVAAHYRGEPPTREQLVDDACYAVQDLRLWWIENAPRTAPRRVAAAPGRNDPCPCGSGKKFKKCHGAG